MCLIALAHPGGPGVRLIVAANRDEFFERPTAPAAFWNDHPEVLAGRDQRAGGTWLGVTKGGRFAAITNYRNPRDRRDDAPSRGALVSDFLTGGESSADYATALHRRAAPYNGFSLVMFDGVEIWFCSNRGAQAYRVSPGVHGLSNHLLDEPWPKVVRAREGIEKLSGEPFKAEDFFAMLADERPAPDDQLPDTGIGLERERRSSSIRILDPVYGTRCSSVLLMRESGEVEFHERSFSHAGGVTGTVNYRFRVEGAASSARAEFPPPRTPDRAR